MRIRTAILQGCWMALLGAGLGPPAAAQNRVTELQRIQPPVLGAAGRFGYHVATDGEWIVIPDDYYGPLPGFFTGGFYAYRYVDGEWRLRQRGNASDAQQGDAFGVSVALDGDWLVFGAVGASAGGAAYVYHREGNTWVEQQKLLPSDEKANKNFGAAVSVQGDLLVVGAYGDDQLAAASGAVYVFRYDGAQWVEEQKLVASNGGQYHRFGTHVAVDGAWIMGLADGIPVGPSESGILYAFQLNGATWTEVQQIYRENYPDWGAGDFALQGDRLMIGSPGEFGSGAVHFLRLVGGCWEFQQVLVSSDGVINDLFGLGLALDGDRLLIGAQQGDEPDELSGSVYLFEYDGADWQEVRKLISGEYFGQTNLGCSAALSGDLLVGGAFRWLGRGAVFVFDAEKFSCAVIPPSAPPGSLVLVSLCNGMPGTPGLLVVAEVEGTPLFLPLLTFFFGPESSAELSFTLPVDLSGLSFGLQAFGKNLDGKVKASSVRSLTIE